MAVTTGTEAPEVAGNPLLGSMLELRADSLGTFLRARRDHGDVVRITAGPPGIRSTVYGVFSADGAQQVLAGESANFRKDNNFYQEIRESFGNGLLTSQDESYLRQRRLVQPLFTRRRVDGYASAIAAEVATLTREWEESGAGTVDILQETTRLALRAVARILFGTDVDEAVEIVESSFPEVGAYVLRRGYSPLNVPRNWPTPANRRAATVHRALYEVCDRIIAARREAGRDPGAGDDLLTLLVAAESTEDGSFDAAELRDQVLVFLLAGHETTATSLGFALHLLARHPEARERAHEEVDRVLGGREPGAADLDALPYLTRVLKEAMRLFPAAPVIGRRSVAATTIGGVAIPAGADVIVAPWVTHRHPDYWTDPERFDPDRFTPEAEAARPRYAWFPFGGGPRACIGQHFSMLESGVALAMILQRYDLDAVDVEVPISSAITLQVDGPARCRLKPRTR
ncbi:MULTISPECIES: cytochrome P450 [unclassified Streptomyces]|uniref:cytochrome P450 n=1 Tax=unclassified Streptomyces TaxID=2593676 RepID=UPI0016616B5C|nr:MULTISPECIES: cytochrome P450 [unclassified Streptomyces]MBD0710178.1 cytochrome P450 [Streptomyces sp. CBMA291]MBD0715352.1 cytochrome P450 [Streptomyces sp. CBMA370]